jgi:hypothetical protein
MPTCARCTGSPKANRIPVVHFEKGESKDAAAPPFLEAAAREGGDGKVLLIGTAQERRRWRSWVRKGQEKFRHPHMDWGRQMAFVTTSTSIFGTRTGAPRSGRATLMRRFGSERGVGHP